MSQRNTTLHISHQRHVWPLLLALRKCKRRLSARSCRNRSCQVGYAHISSLPSFVNVECIRQDCWTGVYCNDYHYLSEHRMNSASVVTVTVYASTTTVGYDPVSSASGSQTSSSSTLSQASTFSTAIRTASSNHAAQSSNNQGNGGTAGYSMSPATTVDTDAGASGSDNAAFNISKGGIIAIAVVCSFVVIFGSRLIGWSYGLVANVGNVVASTVLFVIAKRRQISIRASIARASRRVTGRFGGRDTDKQDKNVRRGGRQYAKQTRADPVGTGGRHANEKATPMVSVKPRPKYDPLQGKAPVNTRPKEQAWVKTLWGGGWK